MQRRQGVVVIGMLMLSGVGYAHVGPRDLSGYIGTDSLQTPAGKPKQVVLPAAFLDFDTSGVATLADNAALLAAGDDAAFSVDISAAGGVHVYGGTLTTCLVHVNGYISCGGSSTDHFDNRSLSDGRLTGSTIFAPFWDDLIAVKDQSTIETYQAAGSFFAVQWNNFSLYNDPTARLTFRVVFEVSATVRPTAVGFQYLTMQSTSGAGADGSSATIGIQNANGWSANQYSFNTSGAIISAKVAPGPTPPPLPTQAVQAILFDFDGDGDRLSQLLESSAFYKTDDANHDFDADGQDDGVEVANGDDPTGTAGDSVVLDATDDDSDTLTGAEEAFYGTDPKKADTDGDSTATTSLNDADEIYTQHTDPTRTDTDRDTFDDGVELDGATNPLDPTSHPPYPITNIAVSTAAKYRPTAATDGHYVHVTAGSRVPGRLGFYYYMIDADGNIRIPETFFKPVDPGNVDDVSDTAIAVYAGKVYIVYQQRGSGGPSVLGLVRLDPSKAPQDGSPVIPITIQELNKNLVTASTAAVQNHPAIAVGSSGIHVVYRGDEKSGGRTKKTGWYYSRYDLDGNLQRSFQLGTGGDQNHGLDRKSRAAITLDAEGGAHILIRNRVGADRGGVGRDYYAQVKNGQLSGPYSLGNINDSAVGIAAKGNLIYLSGAGGGGRGGTVRGAVNLAILDPSQLVSTELAADQWGITAHVDPASMPLPFTSVYLHSAPTKGGAVAIMDNGAAIIAFKTHRNNDNCFGAFAPNGASLGTPFCVATGAEYHVNSNPIPLLLPGNRVGVVFNGSKSDAAVRFVSIPLSGFDLANVPPVPAVNTAPTVTSTPPATATPNIAYSYMAMATDAETPAAQLVWSLVSGPPGLTISSGGAVSWTPSDGDLGGHPVTIQVCDDGGPQRCTQQTFTIGVSNTPPVNLPPQFTSIPSTVAVEGVAYAYQATAVDPDEANVTFTYALASTASGNLAISADGALTWTPGASELGSVNVTIVATGSNGQMAIQSFTVNVLSKNIQAKAGGGCGCVVAGRTRGDEPAPLAMLTVALVAAGLLFRSRRRRAR